MMATLSSLTAGKSPAAANPDRVAAQDGEAADTDVLLSSGEIPFANLLEGELPQASDGAESLPQEVSEAENVTVAELPATPLQAMMIGMPAATDEADRTPAPATVVDEVLPAGERLPPVGVLLSSRLAAGGLPFVGQSLQPGASDGATLAMATVDEMPKQMASQQIDGVAAMMDADKLQKAELPPVVSGEVRTLSSSLLALGVPALREAPADSRVEWAAVPLVPQAEGGKPQALQQLLAERLAVQSSHGMDRALIRLDPPRFGAVEISLQQEGGRLLVQLTASHGEVVRQLQGIGDVLRQELGQRQFHSVQVDIRHGMHDGQQQQQGSRQQAQQEAQPGRALQLDEDGSSGSFAAEKVQA